MTTYIATAADGTTFTRKTEREYAYAVIVSVPDAKPFVKFARTLDLAQKAANSVFPIPKWYGPENRARQERNRARAVIEIVPTVVKGA